MVANRLSRLLHASQCAFRRQDTSVSGSCLNRDTGTSKSSVIGGRVDVHGLPHGGQRIASLILANLSFDVWQGQLGQVYPPGDAQAFKMVGHRSAMDTELPSQFFRRAAVLVLGSDACTVKRGQSTLDWFRWPSRSTSCGEGVDTLHACTERPGARV